MRCGLYLPTFGDFADARVVAAVAAAAEADGWDDGHDPVPDLTGQSFLTPEDVADIRGQLHRRERFEIVVSTYHQADARAYQQAGATWLLACAMSKDEALARAAEGPPILR